MNIYEAKKERKEEREKKKEREREKTKKSSRPSMRKRINKRLIIKAEIKFAKIYKYANDKFVENKLYNTFHRRYVTHIVQYNIIVIHKHE